MVTKMTRQTVASVMGSSASYRLGFGVVTMTCLLEVATCIRAAVIRLGARWVVTRSARMVRTSVLTVVLVTCLGTDVS